MSTLADYEIVCRTLADKFHVSTALLEDGMLDDAIRRAIAERLEYTLFVEFGFVWPMPEVPEE